MSYTRNALRTLAAASIFTLASIAAHASTINFKADLKSSSEVPANDTKGSGSLTADLNTETHTLTYHVEFNDLSGPATAAHFHGPATVGVNSKPQVIIKTKPVTSPIEGTAKLTPEQEKDLLAGQWYFNVHTAQNPGGEIRGQVEKSE